MDEITKKHKQHYTKIFELYGATSKGVDWGDEKDFLFRHKKMLSVLQEDFWESNSRISILDVGCGWGGLLSYAEEFFNIELDYTGIDIVETMVKYASEKFPHGKFDCVDIFDMREEEKYDFVVCNGILTQKHADTTNPEMEHFSRNLIQKMFAICKRGIAFNMMSTRVNFMVENLYYQNPSELLTWLLADVSPRVRIDHGYSSMANGKGKFYDFTIFVYKS